MISMTNDISWFCFTFNVFFSENKSIMIMVVVFTFVLMFISIMIVMLAFMVMFVTFVMMVFSTSCWFPIFILVNKVEVIAMTNYITFCCFTHYIFLIKYIAIMIMVMVFSFVIVVFTFMMMVFSTSCWFPIFILVNKVEVIAMTNYITFCCFTHYIFLIKYIAIMVMIMVFSFVIVVFAVVFMVLCSYYWISLFIFINIMEMVAMTNDIPWFCFTHYIFFIKNITIFNFFMMFMRYWICSHCCSNRFLSIIFINKVKMISVTNNISHFIFFYNIIWIKNISIICRTNCSCRSFLFINSICWRSSIYKMVVISMFF